MSKRDLVFRVLDQKPAERVPVGFWFHFAEPDRLLDYSPETIEANRSGHLRFIREFEPDILKIMTDGFFIYPNETLKALTAPADLDRVEATHPTKWIDDQVALARELVEVYGREAAIFFNIFSPSTHIMFQSRAWKKPLLTQETLLRKNPEGYAHALGEIAKDLGELIRRVISEAGVDGIYLSVRSVANIPAADYARYIAPSELALLSAANALSDYNLLHICGYAGYRNDLSSFRDYPVKAVNWAVTAENVSLLEGRRLFPGKALIGGFENTKAGVLYRGSREEIEAETDRLLRSAGSTGVILGADCTVPSDIPLSHLEWVRQRAAAG